MNSFTLWGGKTIDVGDVTVSNDEENIYVTYETKGNWLLEEVQLYVLNYEPTERLPSGQAPYKAGKFNPFLQSYTFTVPIPTNIECGATLWLQAHASVKEIENGQIVGGETAYGGDVVDPLQGSWYGNIEYVVQCCDEPPPEECFEFKGETAWADGPRYVSRGNWATYTPYVNVAKIEILYAGQNNNFGTVTFSPPLNGLVTITINLTGDWEFADVEENVKIQDYAVALTRNPSPGQFKWKGTASGKSFAIDVPVNNFYGVHADVGNWMEVECPVEEIVSE